MAMITRRQAATKAHKGTSLRRRRSSKRGRKNCMALRGPGKGKFRRSSRKGLRSRGRRGMNNK